MKISAIQNRLQGSKKDSPVKNIPSINYVRSNSVDSFSKQKVSFGGDGAKAGAVLGVMGAFLAAGIVIATGGLAGPAIAAYYAGVLAAPAVGAAGGHIAEKAIKAVKKGLR